MNAGGACIASALCTLSGVRRNDSSGSVMRRTAV
jgi:hypothetical protein